MENKVSRYEASGVSIKKGNSLVNKIKPLAKSTFIPGVLTGLGGFSGLFEIPVNEYNNPILVSGTDGVGTKLKLAADLEEYSTIGIDLVAMCVNDVVVSGARPLFFLDYYATGCLDNNIALSIIKSISVGCLSAGCALVGGETAEMPGLYSEKKYDLAGFCVGIVNKKNIILGEKNVEKGDVLIAIQSSGIHSNGFSLVRDILKEKNISFNEKIENSTLGKKLLIPTKIYVKTILSLLKNFEIKGISHITGGGLSENIPRMLQHKLNAVIDLKSWKFPVIFEWIKNTGKISIKEMLTTFNCGVGMVLAVNEKNCNNVIAELNTLGEKAWKIGYIESNSRKQSYVKYI